MIPEKFILFSFGHAKKNINSISIVSPPNPVHELQSYYIKHTFETENSCICKKKITQSKYWNNVVMKLEVNGNCVSSFNATIKQIPFHFVFSI